MKFIMMRRYKGEQPYGYQIKANVAFELAHGIVVHNARLTRDPRSGYRLRPPQKYNADGLSIINWDFERPELRLAAERLGRAFEQMDVGTSKHTFTGEAFAT